MCYPGPLFQDCSIHFPSRLAVWLPKLLSQRLSGTCPWLRKEASKGNIFFWEQPTSDNLLLSQSKDLKPSPQFRTTEGPSQLVFPTGLSEGFVCNSTILPVQACFCHSLSPGIDSENSSINGLHANLISEQIPEESEL